MIAGQLVFDLSPLEDENTGKAVLSVMIDIPG